MQTWLSHDLCPVFRTWVHSTDGQHECTLGVVGPLSLTFLPHDSQPTACAKRSFAPVCLLPLSCTCVPASFVALVCAPLWVLQQAGDLLQGLCPNTAWLEPGLCCPTVEASVCSLAAPLPLSLVADRYRHSQLSQLLKASHSARFALVFSASSGRQRTVRRQQDVVSQ